MRFRVKGANMVDAFESLLRFWKATGTAARGRRGQMWKDFVKRNEHGGADANGKCAIAAITSARDAMYQCYANQEKELTELNDE